MARVVHDDVKGRVEPGHERAEVFEHRDVPEVQPEHMQPRAPAAAVALLQEAFGSVHGKARGHDEVSAAAQQLEAALVADLLAATGDERVPEASE